MNEDPKSILGVSADAGEEEIRNAYLKKIRQYPPDRAPEEFERVRDAYETLRDPCARTLAMLRSIDPKAPLQTLLESRAEKRRFVGPQLWFGAMKKRRL